jgi:hypothetical protein
MRQIDLYKEKEVEEKLKRNTWFLKIEGVYSVKDLHGEFLCDCWQLPFNYECVV